MVFERSRFTLLSPLPLAGEGWVRVFFLLPFLLVMTGDTRRKKKTLTPTLSRKRERELPAESRE
jgi:hypothetical protein